MLFDSLFDPVLCIISMHKETNSKSGISSISSGVWFESYIIVLWIEVLLHECYLLCALWNS